MYATSKKKRIWNSMHDHVVSIITTKGLGCRRNVFDRTAANRRRGLWQSIPETDETKLSSERNATHHAGCWKYTVGGL